MKKVIKAASLLDKFLEYHDDENNWTTNRNGFDKMYAILEKYDDSNGNDTVDVAFMKATPEDQQKMVELITPGPRHPGERGYAKLFYNKVISGDYEDVSYDYIDGVQDLFSALVQEGYINAADFEEG